jgi:DNA-binding transcriptional MerR regulator
MGTEQWTMSELADRVAGALSSGYDGQPNGRVTHVPDQRAIRYYTTLGLVDRPAAMRGRTALYGPRHLWQLVAIKRLQADGRALADIQHELAGAPDTTLRRLAAIPDRAFWRRVPDVVPLPAPLTTVDTTAPPTTVDTTAPTQGAYQAVPLDGGAVVLIPRRAPLTDRDLAALTAAAGPLTAAIARLTKGQS